MAKSSGVSCLFLLLVGGGQLPLKSDEGQNPAPGASQAVVMAHY